MNKINAFILCFLVFFPGMVFAADHYASPSGSDTWANSTNISTPCSLVTAIQNAAAGDTVHMRGGGTHTVGTRYTPTNDGTEANPIVFQNYQNEDVVIDFSTLQCDGSISVRGDYWQFLVNGTGSVTAHYNGSGIQVAHYGGQVANYTTIDGWKFIGDSACTDNSGAIRVEAPANNTLIQNVEIDGPGTGVNANVSDIWVDNTYGNGDATYTTIRNNEFYDAPSGIYHKHATGNGIDDHVYILNNYVHDVGTRQCFWVTMQGSADSAGANGGSRIDNNLCVNFDIHIGHDGGTGASDNLAITNNTIVGGTVNCENAGQSETPVYCSGNYIYNNVMEQEMEWHIYATVQGQDTTNFVYPNLSRTFNTLSDYNLYASGNVMFRDQSHLTLAQWRTDLAGCPGTLSDCNSIQGSPTFVGDPSPASISDYALAVGSDGKGAGPGGIDIGADVSTVGIGNAGADTTPPTAQSITVDTNGVTVTIVFDEAVTQGAGYNDSDLDIDCSTTGDNITLTYSSGNTTSTHVYTAGSTIQVPETDTCNFDFNGDANSLEDSSGNDLAAIVSQSVTNDSQQGAVASTGKAATYNAAGRSGSYSAGGLTITSP